MAYSLLNEVAEDTPDSPTAPRASNNVLLRSRRKDDTAVSEIEDIHGYRWSIPRAIAFAALGLATGGVLFLVCHWYPRLRMRLLMTRCSLGVAQSVLVVNEDTEWHIETVHVLAVPSASYGATSTEGLTTSVSDSDACTERTPIMGGRNTLGVAREASLRLFEHKHLRYVYSSEQLSFVRCGGIEAGATVGDMLAAGVAGLSEAEYARLQLTYGQNQIDVKVKPYLRMLFEEVLHPFYVFQVFSVTVWLLEPYTVYAICILCLSALSALITLIDMRRNQENLRKMAMYCCDVEVLRAGQYITVSSESLVPGDLMCLPAEAYTLPCDAVLLTGKCIVNESMLTGESVPVSKSALPREDRERPFLDDVDKKSTLYAGTRIIQTRGHGTDRVRALVIRTGFLTSKGGLILSILFPRPSKFKFYSDAFRFVFILAGCAVCGFAYALYTFIEHESPVRTTIKKALDVVTIVVPPALPATMTIGTILALSRLKVSQIFCISPPRVNVCGKLKVFC
eukprot:Opistho-2@19535